MQQLFEILEAEQPRINAVLDTACTRLHPVIQPIAKHILRAGGKRLRPLLTLLMGRCLGKDDAGLYTLAASVELIHAATLLHDDVIDNAETRRGMPAAHLEFGTANTILAGDGLLALASLMVADMNNPTLASCVASTVMATAAGQISETIRLRDPHIDAASYLEIITGKTAYMTRCASELAALYAAAPVEQVTAAAEYGTQLGLILQVVDDALDFMPNTGKPLGGDLREGKMTPPIRFYFDSLQAAEQQAAYAQFAKGSYSDAEIEHIAQCIRDDGHLAATREMANGFIRTANKALGMLPNTSYRQILQQTLEYMQSREH